MITWLHIFEDFIIFSNLILIIYIILKYIRCGKFNCNNNDITLDILNKNMDILNILYKKQYSKDLKKMIDLYSEVQTILKISDSSFISLFKYNYSKSYVLLDFMFSINKGGEIIHESYLDKLPATSNMLSLEILKSKSDDLSYLITEDIKSVDMKVYQLLKYRNIEKTYFRNIIRKGNDLPLGYIAFTYDNLYELDDIQREEILRITSKISDLL